MKNTFNLSQKWKKIYSGPKLKTKHHLQYLINASLLRTVHFFLVTEKCTKITLETKEKVPYYEIGKNGLYSKKLISEHVRCSFCHTYFVSM